MSDDPARPPHFPYVAALLCAACVGMAGYLWMRYSYAWDVTVRDLATGVEANPFVGRYVTLHGVLSRDPSNDYGYMKSDAGPGAHGTVIVERLCPSPEVRGTTTVKGRVYVQVRRSSRKRHVYAAVDASASRFTGASIAGLVVGAMGVFVFTVALRHWLGERRRFREEARA